MGSFDFLDYALLIFTVRDFIFVHSNFVHGLRLLLAMLTSKLRNDEDNNSHRTNKI